MHILPHYLPVSSLTTALCNPLEDQWHHICLHSGALLAALLPTSYVPGTVQVLEEQMVFGYVEKFFSGVSEILVHPSLEQCTLREESENTDREVLPPAVIINTQLIVTLFYGILILVYAVLLTAFNKIFSLLYTIAAPTCNPLVYSLKQEDVKESMRKLRI
ncbi:Olfactory receptor 508 [Plecturocebus cupreus]